MHRKTTHFYHVLFLLAICLSVQSANAQGEEMQFKSVLVDQSWDGIGGAYIKNLNSNRFAVSDTSGLFSIPCNIGDTLIISAMTYELKKVIVNEHVVTHIQLDRMLNTLNEVNVYDFKSYEHFKRQVLELELEEPAVNVTGLPNGPPSKVPVRARSNEFSSPPGVLGILSPFSTLGYYLNDDEKSKRRLWEMMRIDERDRIYWTVMHADSIQEWTNVPDSLLDDFIVYCNLKIEDKSLEKTYYYKEKISKLYPLFLEERKK